MLRFAGVLLLLLLTYQLVAQAQVAPSIITRVEYPSRSQRTMFNIIWGCVSTTIICAWAAILPNVPPREGQFKGTLRRLELMFWTIVAPEILPCWVLNQLLAAMTVRDVYNNGKGYDRKSCRIWETVKRCFSLYEIKEAATEEWTRTHGHFLIMGGFHVVEPPNTRAVSRALVNKDTEKGHGRSENKPEPGGRETILTLELLVKDPEFKIQITEEEITDRSKGDALSKIIFIMQSTWFILQCIGRRAQGLDLTQLELTTLALASLNGITFILWWDKPLSAQSIVRVYLNRKLTDSERPDPGFRSTRSTVIPIIRYCVTPIRDTFLCQPEGLVRLPFAILFVLLSPAIVFSVAFFSSLNDLLGMSISFPPDDTHVPTFYVPKHRYSEWWHISLVVLGVIFGGIRCSGWNFPFPTLSQQKLWRVASLAVTTIPIIIFPLALIIDSAVTCRLTTFEPMIESGPGTITFFICTLAYVVARLVLLVLALALLWHLPPAAFTAIDWTRFYPHIL